MDFSFPKVGAEAPTGTAQPDEGLPAWLSKSTVTHAKADGQRQTVSISAAVTTKATATPLQQQQQPEAGEAGEAGAGRAAEETSSSSSSGQDQVSGGSRLAEKTGSQLAWMREAAATPTTSQPGAAQRKVMLSELRKHKTPDDAWIAVKGKVYDVTSYLKYHPGGAKVLLSAAGKDGTSLFLKHHSWVDIDYMLEKSLVGVFHQ